VLRDYHIPSVADIPHQLNVTLLPGKPNDKLGVLSSKATAEPPVMLSQSVHFALRHAVASARKDNGRNDWFDWPMPATAQTIQTLCMLDASKIKPEQI
jgi:xanthine dehydrogenase/oxidase